MADWSPRPEPYTNEEIAQQACVRCGEPASHQWQVCADGGSYRPLCRDCDVQLNAIVLDFMRHPHTEWLLVTYEKAIPPAPPAARRGATEGGAS